MTSRYLITLTDRNAELMERWFGHGVHITPSEWLASGVVVAVPVAGLDAITDEEYEHIAQRLRTSGPRYHHGGPGHTPPGGR